VIETNHTDPSIQEASMKHKFNSLVAFVIVAPMMMGSALTVMSPDRRGGEQAGVAVAPCGGLRLDEYYACRYGNGRPDPLPEARTVLTALVASQGASELAVSQCSGLRLDAFYACQNENRWPGLSENAEVQPIVGAAGQGNIQPPVKSCGGLALDTSYACRFGNWQPDTSLSGD
jgi:hypothetical protein